MDGENTNSGLKTGLSLIGGVIALVSILTVCYISAFVDLEKGLPVLTNVIGSIVGFYFGTQYKR